MIVPSPPNAGDSPASDSAVTPSRIPSSVATSRSGPRRCGTLTSTSSSAITPLAVAAAARWCERAANASWSARLTCTAPQLPASVSAPIDWSV